MTPGHRRSSRNGGHLFTGLVAFIIIVLMGSSAISDISFTSPQDGDTLTQKAISVSGTASAAPSFYIEDDYVSFDEGTKVNVSLQEEKGTDGLANMTLAPYIGTWAKSANNPVIDLGGGGDFNEVDTTASGMIMDGNTYKIWGSGNDGTDWEFGLFTSNDGKSWTPSGSNPVFSPSASAGAFDHDQILSPYVIKDGATYKMWYSGKATDGKWRIGYATSADGTSWTRGNSGQPVLGSGTAGKFDGGGVAHPCVIKDGATYKMWYAGLITGSTLWQIGYAVSNNGIDWTRQNNSNPVLGFGKRGSFDEGGVNYPRVIKDGNLYRMWFVGWSSKEIGYAESNNGALWGKSQKNPVISKGAAAEFDETSITAFDVYKDDCLFKIWYTGKGNGYKTVGYATAGIMGLEGTYTSKPFDAGYPVDWGNIIWNWSTPASTSATMETRTSPDRSAWSTWTEETNGGATASPPNKYFQYKVTQV